MEYTFSNKISALQPSAIREILKATADPAIIPLAAGNPAPDAFPVDEVRAITADILQKTPIDALQYGVSEGYQPLRDTVRDWLARREKIGTDGDDLLIVSGATLPQDLCALAEDELNVKEVVFTESAREFTTYQLKPQMRTLGPKYGKLLGKIGQHLQTMDGNDVVDAFGRGETVSFDIEGTTVTLGKDDVLTSPMQKSGFVAQEDKGVTVVLDTNLTPELIAEGYVREVVSKVQTMRKESDFDVTDRVDVRYECGDVLASAIESGVDMLKRGTLAEVVERAPMDDTFIVRDWSINGQDCKLGVRVHK